MRLPDDEVQKRDKIALNFLRRNPSTPINQAYWAIRINTKMGMSVDRLSVLRGLLLQNKKYDLGVVRDALHALKNKGALEAVPMAQVPTAGGKRQEVRTTTPAVKQSHPPGEKKVGPDKNPSGPFNKPASENKETPRARRLSADARITTEASRLFVLMKELGVKEVRVRQHPGNPSKMNLEYELPVRVSKTV